VVGCRDLGVSARLFTALGFSESRRERIPAELAATLWGLRGRVETLAVSMPGSRLGWIRLVEVDGPPRGWRPYRVGPVLLELYVRSIAEAVAFAEEAGARPVGRTAYTATSAQRFDEVRLVGPDEIGIGLTQSTSARPSLLDTGRRVSELCSTLWVVESVAEALPGYPELEVSRVSTIDDYEPVAEFLGLPHDSASIRTVYLGAPGEPLERLQLLEFQNRSAEPEPEVWPMRPGIFAVGSEAEVEAPMTTVRPGGVRLEIWPR
jgi:hypothetical protein